MADFERAIGLDTSVVVRLLTGEPPDQAARALAFVSESRQASNVIFVSDLVVTEAYYALHAHYGVPKSEALRTLLDLMESGLVQPEPGGCALDALRAMKSAPQKPGFADRLIHAQYRRHSAGLASFESASRRLAGARLLGG